MVATDMVWFIFCAFFAVTAIQWCEMMFKFYYLLSIKCLYRVMCCHIVYFNRLIKFTLFRLNEFERLNHLKVNNHSITINNFILPDKFIAIVLNNNMYRAPWAHIYKKLQTN